MPYFIRHKSTNTYYGQIKGKPPLNWPKDIEQARPYASRLSAQGAITHLACTFAGDHPSPVDFSITAGMEDQGVSLETVKLRRRALYEALMKWSKLRDEWVEEFSVIEVGIAAAKKQVKLSPEERKAIITKIAEEKASSAPNAIGNMGGRILNVEDME
jgi:hypothetical protein